MRADSLEVEYARCKHGSEWTPEGLLRHFAVRWQDRYGCSFVAKSMRAELRHAELLVGHVGGELAFWCVEALFSEHMDWCKVKTLDFLSDYFKLNRYVVPVAADLRKARGKKAEWRAGDALGVVNPSFSDEVD